MHHGTVGQTQWLDPFNRDRRCDRWLREEDMLKRWVIFNATPRLVLQKEYSYEKG